jgi:hypothetical protein
MKKIFIISLGLSLSLLGVFGLDSMLYQDSLDEVLEDVYSDFDVESFHVGLTNNTVWVDVNEGEDIPEVEKYLENNLSDEDLKSYDLEIF